MNEPGKLEFALAREVLIRAPRGTVFRYFTDSARFARWWGEGSRIEPAVGGAVSIVYPGGTRASGVVLEIVPGERIVFSYGYDGQAALPPGGSRVTITLRDDPVGTRVQLRHELGDQDLRDHHVQGWRYHLAVFANVVANEAHAQASALADRWFAAWNDGDAAARQRALDAITTPEVEHHDAYSCNRGRDDLLAHVAASRQHMPGIALARVGEARQCQGSALVDWVAHTATGGQAGGGTNLFEFSADGKIARVVGFVTRLGST
jgi:uncharacterized protein YndB with AHSA1/START domain